MNCPYYFARSFFGSEHLYQFWRRSQFDRPLLQGSNGGLMVRKLIPA